MAWPPPLVPYVDRCGECGQKLARAITPKEFDADETPHDYAICGGRPGKEGYLCVRCWRKLGVGCKVQKGAAPLGVIINKVNPRVGGLGIAFSVYGRGQIAVRLDFTPVADVNVEYATPCTLVFTSGGHLVGNEIHGLTEAGNPYRVTWMPSHDGVEFSKTMIAPACGPCSCEAA